MRHFINAFLVFSLLGFSVQCTHGKPQNETVTNTVEGYRFAASSNDWLMDLPGDGTEFEADMLLTWPA